MNKPTVGTALKTTNPFYANLTNAWGILETSGAALADSKAGNTIALGSGWSITPDVNGDPGVASPAGLSLSHLVTPISLTARATWSLAWKMSVTDSQSTIVGNSASPNDSYLDVYGTPNTYSFRFVNSDGTNATTSDATMSNPSGYYAYVLTSSGNFLEYYQESLNFKQSDVFTNGSRLTIDCFGGGGSTSTWFYGFLSYMFLWQGRILTQTEVNNFTANPWQLFETSAPTAGTGGIMLAHL